MGQKYNSYLDPMIVLVNKYLLRKGFSAIALWPFVIVRDREALEDVVFINHERIHLHQQLELLVLPFYFWYALEFLIRFFYSGKPHWAYRNLSFEREAYGNENNLDYCKNRKLWGFIRYLRS